MVIYTCSIFMLTANRPIRCLVCSVNRLYKTRVANLI